MPPARLPDDLRHCYSDVNGIRMHYVEAGSGDLILFLHGFPESWYAWRHQLAALAPSYRVVAPDLRGCGETEASGPYDTTTLQADIAALIARLGAERVHLVGHDWGGMLAWLLALSRPELLKSITICNAPHPALFQKALRHSWQLVRSWYILAFQIPRLPERLLAASSYRRLARVILRDARPGTFTREDIVLMLATWRRGGLTGGLNWYRALLRHRQPLPAPLPVITVPTLVIWGEDDTALDRRVTVGMEPYVASLALVYLENTSHWVQEERPERVNELILGHVRSAGAT